MRRVFILAALCAILFSFSAEASISLTKDHRNSRPLPEFIKPSPKHSSKAKKSNPNAESSFSHVGFHPELAAWIEYFEDERRRIEYLKNKDYITSSTRWLAYTDKNLGAYIEYPDIFPKELERPIGAEGLWVQSSDGYVKLTVLYSYNTSGETAEGILREISSNTESIEVLKKEYNDGWYRFVYRRACDTVHRYGIIRGYVKAEFILGYPNEKSEQFRAITKQMEQTLQITE